MADRTNGRPWILIIRMPADAKEADWLLFHGSQPAVVGWEERIRGVESPSNGVCFLTDCARTDMPQLIEQVLEQHRQRRQPFSAVIFDAFGPFAGICLKPLKQLISQSFPDLPVYLVVRGREVLGPVSPIRVLAWSRPRQDFIFPGEEMSDGYLRKFLRAQLAH